MTHRVIQGGDSLDRVGHLAHAPLVEREPIEQSPARPPQASLFDVARVGREQVAGTGAQPGGDGVERRVLLLASSGSQLARCLARAPAE